jgi:hypothetical protein
MNGVSGKFRSGAVSEFAQTGCRNISADRIQAVSTEATKS